MHVPHYSGVSLPPAWGPLGGGYALRVFRSRCASEFCQPIPLFAGPLASLTICSPGRTSLGTGCHGAVSLEAPTPPSPMQTESSWLYRSMCRAGCRCTLGCISLFMCALPALPVAIEFLSILDLKLVVVPAEESGVRGVEREEVHFDALRGKGNGGDCHIGETVEWGMRIGLYGLNLRLFIKITDSSPCIFKVCFRFPCGLLLWQSLPFH